MKALLDIFWGIVIALRIFTGNILVFTGFAYIAFYFVSQWWAEPICNPLGPSFFFTQGCLAWSLTCAAATAFGIGVATIGAWIRGKPL